MLTRSTDAEAWCVKPGQPCIKLKRDAEAWCVKPGQPCIKLKRAAEAIAAAYAEPMPDPEPWCVKPGQPCIKGRSAEADAAAFCYRSAGPCSIARRNARAMAVAAAEALAALE
jgi:hypothetical protein